MVSKQFLKSKNTEFYKVAQKHEQWKTKVGYLFNLNEAIYRPELPSKFDMNKYVDMFI